MAIDKTRCQIGEHCHGTGVIEAHVVEWDLLVLRQVRGWERA